MSIETIKPLNESDLYSRFQDLGGLFELIQKKTGEIADGAGVTQAELACLMAGISIGAQISAWIMRHQLGRGGVVVDREYINRVGPTIIANLDAIHQLVEGIPLSRWNNSG